MNHRCEEKNRIEEMRTVIGQNAYSYYSEWMRKSKRAIPPVETFIHSSYYNSFIRFAHHVEKVSMPGPMVFIKFMIDQKMLPALWCRDNVYAMYMQQFDNEVTPETQYIDSVDFMHDWAFKHEIEVPKVFETMGVDRLLNNVQKRKLSPWFLATSSVFREWKSTLDGFDGTRVEDAVKVGALMIRIKSDPDMMKLFGELCRASKEFNL